MSFTRRGFLKLLGAAGIATPFASNLSAIESLVDTNKQGIELLKDELASQSSIITDFLRLNNVSGFGWMDRSSVIVPPMYNPNWNTKPITQFHAADTRNKQRKRLMLVIDGADQAEHVVKAGHWSGDSITHFNSVSVVGQMRIVQEEPNSDKTIAVISCDGPEAVTVAAGHNAIVIPNLDHTFRIGNTDIARGAGLDYWGPVE